MPDHASVPARGKKGTKKPGATRPAAATRPGAAAGAAAVTGPDPAAPGAPAGAAAVTGPGPAGPGTPAGVGSAEQAAAPIGVRKTYKLFIGGAFPRSESGRSYPVTGPGGAVLANAAQASRKDARDAVVAARKAFTGWAGATAYNRGQILYRVAEMLQGRAAQFAAECAAADRISAADAERAVTAAIGRWVWYAGWPDKVAQVAGSANPVAGPYFNFSVPEPTGVVAVAAPAGSSLLGLVSVLAPVIATGNTAVAVASETGPLPAITLAEVLATSDLPGGVVNILTGRSAELMPVLAAHMDVNAIDLTGVAPDARGELERLAAGNVKRVFAAGGDWDAPPTPARMLAFLETKTVWHPIGR